MDMDAILRGVRGSAIAAGLLFFCGISGGAGQDEAARAAALHRRAIVIDTHADTPQRMLFDPGFDFAARHTDGHLDLPRMQEGGLDAVFLSIWVPGEVTGAPAVERALRLIDRVHETVRLHPSALVLATTAAEIRKAAAEGRTTLLLGIEGGHMIHHDLGILRIYARLGARYLTLTHFLNNDWADSSTDKPKHHGLTPFGRDVVRELNRLGMMVDVSHVADSTFEQVLAVTRAPVLASHSSCRQLCNHPRNMSDDMLRALARNGGAVMINYENSFLSEAFRKAEAARGRDVTARKDSSRCKGNSPCETIEEQRHIWQEMKEGTLPPVHWELILDHIDHAVRVAGIDHVGLGSDFDGANMPIGMEDATHLPQITAGLLRRGYKDADIEKILGGNVLRVMEQVEKAAGK